MSFRCLVSRLLTHASSFLSIHQLQEDFIHPQMLLGGLSIKMRLPRINLMRILQTTSYKEAEEVNLSNMKQILQLSSESYFWDLSNTLAFSIDPRLLQREGFKNIKEFRIVIKAKCK